MYPVPRTSDAIFGSGLTLHNKKRVYTLCADSNLSRNNGKMVDEKIGSLEEEALKRKARLQALKKKNEENKETENNTAENLPK